MTEQNKHTPGPWMWWDSCSWRRLGTDDQSTLIMSPTLQQSDGHPDLYFPNGGYQGPDASLIAAAPDLLEALQYARRFLNHKDHDVDFVDNVLAKAKGEK